MNDLFSRFAVIALIVVLLSAAGCEPSAPPAGGTAVTSGGPPAPPPPPGGAASTPVPTATPAPAAPSSLPADLVKKIDALIQSHKDYSAIAEQVQDGQSAKDRFDELSGIAQRSSDAHDDVMIGTKQLTPAQMAEFEAYMDLHVTPVWNTRKAHQSRLEGVLPR